MLLYFLEGPSEKIKGDYVLKKLKKTLLPLLISFSFLIGLAVPVSAKEENKTLLQFVYVLQGELPADADQELIALLEDSGWVIKNKKMEKRVLGRQQEMSLEDGTKIKTNKEGMLELPIVGDEQEIELTDKRCLSI